MEFIKNSQSLCVLDNIINVIHENKDYLSKVDGDHGVNMDKGFMLCKDRIEGKDISLAEGFDVLGLILMTEIGGSMGPLYGMFFVEMAKSIKETEEINKEVFTQMIKDGCAGIQEIGDAKAGDKTLLDALIPAIEASEKAVEEGKTFEECLENMRKAAAKGRDSTKEMVAKVGRASRLGERSRGVLDAGATSCALILESMASSCIKIIKE